jgi:hypothetical protein
MSGLAGDPTTTLMLLAIALLVHEPFRWVGLFVGNRLDVQSPWFQWVRSVATALVAGLVMRLVLFPAGALADIGIAVRCVAMIAGIAVYFVAGRRLALAVGTAAAVLVVLQLAIE